LETLPEGEEMIIKNKMFQLSLAFSLGIMVLIIPRPEGTKFRITGDEARQFYAQIRKDFNLISSANPNGQEKSYIVEVKDTSRIRSPATYLSNISARHSMKELNVDYVNGLSPKAKRFLAILTVLIFLFVVEPIPLEITAICIGVFLVIMGISDVKGAWAPYMHPVVVFIMCCLIFAISLDKAGLTRRLGYFIIKKAGTSVTRFTFVLAMGLGVSSAFMHDAAATAIGIITILPLMRAAGIEPHSRTGKFMMLSIPFACSCGGMGTLVGGGRCMVAAAFLKEFTGLEITFLDWIKYAMPAAILTVPVAVFVVYLVFRPDPKFKLPQFDQELGRWSKEEKKTLMIIGMTFLLWLTKGFHGIHYSVTGMLGVGALVLFDILKWEDIHNNLEWGTALFIFGGGISLGLAMGYSGAADYFANLFFPLIQGGGWVLLFIGVAVFGALVTNAMANVDGSVGGRGSHSAGFMFGNGHFFCDVACHRLSAQRDCLQLSLF